MHERPQLVLVIFTIGKKSVICMQGALETISLSDLATCAMCFRFCALQKAFIFTAVCYSLQMIDYRYAKTVSLLA